MAKKLKVYGWTGYRIEAGNGTHRHQTREICAAYSMAEVARIAGVNRASQLFCLCETGNAKEIERATGKPGVIFWTELDHPARHTWREAAPAPAEDGGK
jgi:hypothetical protein